MRKSFNVFMIDFNYLAFFAGNAMVSCVGEMYETMPTTQFWLLHAGFAAVAGAVFLLFKLTLAKRLMREEEVVLPEG